MRGPRGMRQPGGSCHPSWDSAWSHPTCNPARISSPPPHAWTQQEKNQVTQTRSLSCPPLKRDKSSHWPSNATSPPDHPHAPAWLPQQNQRLPAGSPHIPAQCLVHLYQHSKGAGERRTTSGNNRGLSSDSQGNENSIEESPPSPPHTHHETLGNARPTYPSCQTWTVGRTC